MILRAVMAVAFVALGNVCSAASPHLEDAASLPTAKVSSLPEILLIGDSIRIGYCGAALTALPECG